MRKQSGTLATVVSALGGMVIGLLLEAPLFLAQVEPLLSPFVPQLRRLDAQLQALGVWYVSEALVAFLLHLPKTVLLAAIAGIALSAPLVARRVALYAVFLAPLLSHSFYWLQIWRLKQGAEKLGLPQAVESLPTDPRIGVTAFFILLTYGLFAVLVFALLWVRGKTSAAPA